MLPRSLFATRRAPAHRETVSDGRSADRPLARGMRSRTARRLRRARPDRSASLRACEGVGGQGRSSRRLVPKATGRSPTAHAAGSGPIDDEPRGRLLRPAIDPPPFDRSPADGLGVNDLPMTAAAAEELPPSRGCAILERRRATTPPGFAPRPPREAIASSTYRDAPILYIASSTEPPRPERSSASAATAPVRATTGTGARPSHPLRPPARDSEPLLSSPVARTSRRWAAAQPAAR